MPVSTMPSVRNIDEVNLQYSASLCALARPLVGRNLPTRESKARDS